MIVLDTNVVSFLMKALPREPLLAWLNEQSRGTVWATAITVYEVRVGLLRLPLGRRRLVLEQQFAAFLSEDLDGRVLPFDQDAAEKAAALDATRRAAGRNIDIRDTLIAGIVLARGATLATRNLRDFADLQVPVIDPWTA